MKHAAQLFPIALQELLAIGEKGMKQREQGERVARPRETRACMHAACREKQAKQLQLQLKKS